MIVYAFSHNLVRMYDSSFIVCIYALKLQVFISVRHLQTGEIYSKTPSSNHLHT